MHAYSGFLLQNILKTTINVGLSYKYCTINQRLDCFSNKPVKVFITQTISFVVVYVTRDTVYSRPKHHTFNARFQMPFLALASCSFLQQQGRRTSRCFDWLVHLQCSQNGKRAKKRAAPRRASDICRNTLSTPGQELVLSTPFLSVNYVSPIHYSFCHKVSLSDNFAADRFLRI